jgi:hypothetical protein
MKLAGFLCPLIVVLAPVVSAAPGAVHCGKLKDVTSGKLLLDQVVVFDDNGTVTAVGAATSTRLPQGGTPLAISPLPPVFRIDRRPHSQRLCRPRRFRHRRQKRQQDHAGRLHHPLCPKKRRRHSQPFRGQMNMRAMIPPHQEPLRIFSLTSRSPVPLPLH